jgi:hypothetical protein
MNKEETLKALKHQLSPYTREVIGGVYEFNQTDANTLKKLYDELKNFINAQPSIPTSEQVCDALSAELENNVYYENNNFYTAEYSDVDCLVSYHKGRIIIHSLFAPHLITMIGQFYEKELRKNG